MIDCKVGAFPHYGGRWAEWNGNFRDTVRSFIKGSEGPWAQAFASSVCGSPSIYAAEQPGDGESFPPSFPLLTASPVGSPSWLQKGAARAHGRKHLTPLSAAHSASMLPSSATVSGMTAVLFNSCGVHLKLQCTRLAGAGMRRAKHETELACHSCDSPSEAGVQPSLSVRCCLPNRAAEARGAL